MTHRVGFDKLLYLILQLGVVVLELVIFFIAGHLGLLGLGARLAHRIIVARALQLVRAARLLLMGLERVTASLRLRLELAKRRIGVLGGRRRQLKLLGVSHGLLPYSKGEVFGLFVSLQSKVSLTVLTAAVTDE